MTIKRRGIQLKEEDNGSVVAFPSARPADPFGSSSVKLVNLRQIVPDQICQLRADGLDADYVADLAQVYATDHDAIPPIVVFAESDVMFWLADGFHRHAAMLDAGIVEAQVKVYQGDRRAAMRYALQANTHYGKRRTLADAAFAYRHAVAEGLCEPADVPAVAALLGISDRWAREITREVRDQLNAERDATIQRLAEEGKSQREIAKQVGVTQQSISKLLYNKRNSSESCHPDLTPDLDAERKSSEMHHPDSASAPLTLHQSPPGDLYRGGTEVGVIDQMLADGVPLPEIATRVGLPLQHVVNRQSEVNRQRRARERYELALQVDPRAQQAAVDLPRVLRDTLNAFDGAPPAFQIVKAMQPADRAAYARVLNALAEHLDYAREALKVVDS